MELDSVAVWWVDVDSFRSMCPRFVDCLSPEERARADRFARAEDRVRFVVSHAAVRHILVQYLDLTPAEIRFATGPNGKPRLIQADLQFNLSHSAGYGVVAVAGTAVGIDIEHIRPIPDLDSIVERFFTPPERDYLAAVDVGKRAEAFYRCWCRKEAYVKATGKGLSLDPSMFSVSVDPERPALVDTVEGEAAPARWSIGNIGAPPGYMGAVVVEGRMDSLVERPWRPGV